MDENFPYKIKKSRRAKRISITVYADATVHITVPARVPLHVARKFLYGKLEWIRERIEELRRKEPRQRIVYPSYLQSKQRALSLAVERLQYYNQFYGLTYSRVRIKNQKTKWGSCSQRKNINFNYRIAFLPLELADYIVVHELCHLTELNHSKKFWQLVAKTIPDWRQRRSGLRQYQLR